MTWICWDFWKLTCSSFCNCPKYTWKNICFVLFCFVLCRIIYIPMKFKYYLVIQVFYILRIWRVEKVRSLSYWDRNEIKIFLCDCCLSTSSYTFVSFLLFVYIVLNAHKFMAVESSWWNALFKLCSFSLYPHKCLLP